MRPTKPGTIQDAVAGSYRAVGGVETVGELLGLAISTVSYGTEIAEHRPGGLGVNYLDRLARINPIAARPVAEHFAGLALGHFQPMIRTAEASLYEHCSLVAKECGEAQAAAIKAAHSAEAQDIEEADREIGEAIAALARARAALKPKRGNFSALRGEA
jgi:hypothetical protein